MQIDIDITDNLSKYAQQLPFVMSKTINDLLFDARVDVIDEIKKTVDNPTAFTTKAVEIKKTIKSDTDRGYIKIRDNRATYLQYLYYGGTEKPKKKYLRGITKHSKLNKQGNFTRNKVNQLLKNKKKYFSGTAKGMNGNNIDGIWERMRGRKIRMVLSWEDEFKHKKVMDFHKTVRQTFSINLSKTFTKNIKRALK